MTMRAYVVSDSASGEHAFSKRVAEGITLLEGIGVAGDAHCGATVKHRSRVARDPSQPNLRQIHLIHEELFGELAARGFTVAPGDLGENITTRGVGLLALPEGTELQIGPSAIVRLTGLRNPCAQLDGFHPGLVSAVLDRAPDGALVRKSGVMGVVVRGGPVRRGDGIAVYRPEEPHRPLDRV